MRLSPLSAAALLVAVASAAAPSAFLQVGQRRSGRVAAAAWLQARAGQPSDDDLDELRTTNPDAYAIVKSLLMKRQLGILDARRPNGASFAPAAEAEAAAPVSLARVEEQRAAWEDQAKLTATATSVAYPEATARASKPDWFAWKPTAESDAAPASEAPPPSADAAHPVDRLALASAAASDLMKDGAALDDLSNRHTAATATKPGSFWGGLTTGLTAALSPDPQVQAAALSQVPPVAMTQEAGTADQGSNPLLSFDWVAPAEEEAAPPRAQAPPPAAGGGNNYLQHVGWAADAPAPSSGENPYLALSDMRPHQGQGDQAAAAAPPARESTLEAWLLAPRDNPAPPHRHY